MTPRFSDADKCEVHYGGITMSSELQEPVGARRLQQQERTSDDVGAKTKATLLLPGCVRDGILNSVQAFMIAVGALEIRHG